MVIILKRICNWLNKTIDNFNCGLNGHGNIIVLKTYDCEEILRNWDSHSSLSNLKQTTIQKRKIFKQKCVCRNCNGVFIRIFAECTLIES